MEFLQYSCSVDVAGSWGRDPWAGLRGAMEVLLNWGGCAGLSHFRSDGAVLHQDIHKSVQAVCRVNVTLKAAWSYSSRASLQKPGPEGLDLCLQLLLLCSWMCQAPYMCVISTFSQLPAEREVPDLAKTQTTKKKVALLAAFQLSICFAAEVHASLFVLPLSVWPFPLWAMILSPFYDFSELGLPASYPSYVYNK